VRRTAHASMLAILVSMVTAGLVEGEAGEAAFDEGRYHIADPFVSVGEIGLNTGLQEAFQRTGTHAPGRQSGDADLCQGRDGGKAVAVFMRVNEKRRAADDAASLDLEDREGLAMSEMGGHFGIRAAGGFRRHGKNNIHDNLLMAFVNGSGFCRRGSGEVLRGFLVFLHSAQTHDLAPLPGATRIIRRRPVGPRASEWRSNRP
jgi:hypothetical protein